MNKKELIQLHQLFKNLREERFGDHSFSEYEDLNVKPSDTKKGKKEHKKAIFTISKEMAEKMSDEEWDDSERLRERMKELLEDV